MKVNVEAMRKIAGIVCYMFVLLSLSSCLDDENIDPVPVALVSFFHASPNAPDLDVLLDDQRLFNQPLKYTDYFSYRRFYTGNRDLSFNAHNASNVLTDTSYNFQADKAYSVFVINELDALSTLIVQDSVDTLNEGKAWIRMIHLSPDGPAVNLTVGDASTPTFANQQYRQAAGFIEVDADDYTMRLTAATGGAVLATVPETELRSRGIYTVVVRGFVTPPAGNTNGLSVQIVQNQ